MRVFHGQSGDTTESVAWPPPLKQLSRPLKGMGERDDQESKVKQVVVPRRNHDRLSGLCLLV